MRRCGWSTKWSPPQLRSRLAAASLRPATSSLARALFKCATLTASSPVSAFARQTGTEITTETTSGPLHRPPTDPDGARDVRRVGPRLPDLQRDTDRRSRGADGGPPGDPDPDRGHPQRLGVRPEHRRAVHDHDEEGLHRRPEV